jgi:hypothetical protein
VLCCPLASTEVCVQPDIILIWRGPTLLTAGSFAPASPAQALLCVCVCVRARVRVRVHVYVTHTFCATQSTNGLKAYMNGKWHSIMGSAR